MKRTLIASAALLATVALAGCGEDTADVASPSTSVSSSETSAAVTPTESAAPSGNVTNTSAAPTPAPSEKASNSPAPSATKPSTCLEAGADYAPLNITGVGEDAAATAMMLRDAASMCNKDILVNKATADKTSLSFGMVTPSKAFAIPQPKDENRYALLVKLLGMKPVEETSHGQTSYIWPRVHSKAGAKDPAAWKEVVDAGLITEKQSREMQKRGSGYMGYRLGITASGTWQYFIAGD